MPAKTKHHHQQAAAHTKGGGGAQQTDRKKAADKGNAAKGPAAPLTADSIPIAQRRFDYFFVASYMIFFAVLAVVFITRCQHVLPEKFQGQDFAAPVCEKLHLAKPSMRGVLDSHREWSKLVYTAKTEWVMDVVHRVNLFFTGPFAPILAFGIFFGYRWAKNLGLVHSAVMLYNMLLIDLIGWSALHSADKGIVIQGQDPVTLFGLTYGFFTVLPILLIWRLRSDFPFSGLTLLGRGNFLMRWIRWWMKVACWSFLFAMLISYYEFTIKNVEGWKELPSVVDSTSTVWANTAEHRELAINKGLELTDLAATYATQAGITVSQAAEGLGNSLLEMAQNMQKGGAPTEGNNK